MAELPKSKVISPLHVYFDDTGCNAVASPDFIWAGYWASLLFWQRFGTAWNKILDFHPKLPYWHQAKARARHRKAPFDVLSDAQLESREQSLCNLMFDNKKRMMPMAVRVSNADIGQHVTGKITCARPLSRDEQSLYRPDLMEREHFIALFHAVAAVTKLNKELGGEHLPVSVHCEDREFDPFQDYMKRVWILVSKIEKSTLGVLDFPKGKSRQAPQLQAADMLAWHLNRQAGGIQDDPMYASIAGDWIYDHRITADSLRAHVDYWNKFNPPHLKLKPGEVPQWTPST